jgi:hypothetical protein
MAKAIRELTEEMKAKTDAAADDLQAMDDDSLEEAVGGAYYYVSNGESGRKRKYNCYEDYKEGEEVFPESPVFVISLSTFWAELLCSETESSNKFLQAVKVVAAGDKLPKNAGEKFPLLGI